MWNKTQQKLRAWLEYNDNIIGLLSTFVDDKILIDVGANRGQIYRQWASLNPNTKIIAIDPVDKAYEVYKSYTNIPNVTFIQIAISNRKATAIEFLKASQFFGLSGIKSSHPNNHSLMQPPYVIEHHYAGKIDIEEITVPCDTLDNIFKDELENISLIKMDIEGGEYFAIKGAEQIIKNSRPIITVEPRFPAVCSIIEILNKYDYEVCDMYGYSIHNQVHNIPSDLLFYPKEKQDVVNFVNDIFITNYKPQNFKVTTVLGEHNIRTIADERWNKHITSK